MRDSLSPQRAIVRSTLLQNFSGAPQQRFSRAKGRGGRCGSTLASQSSSTAKEHAMPTEDRSQDPSSSTVDDVAFSITLSIFVASLAVLLA